MLYKKKTRMAGICTAWDCLSKLEQVNRHFPIHNRSTTINQFKHITRENSINNWYIMSTVTRKSLQMVKRKTIDPFQIVFNAVSSNHLSASAWPFTECIKNADPRDVWGSTSIFVTPLVKWRHSTYDSNQLMIQFRLIYAIKKSATVYNYESEVHHENMPI